MFLTYKIKKLHADKEIILKKIVKFNEKFYLFNLSSFFLNL